MVGHVRSLLVYSGMLAVLVVAPQGTSLVAAPNSNSSQLGNELRAIVSQGFDRRVPLKIVESRATRARALAPQSAEVDYALGLVFMKRLQYKEAAERFSAAIALAPASLPARAAILRMHLLRKQSREVLADAEKFASAIGGPKGEATAETERRAGAAFLGRVMAFLAKPETRLVDVNQLEATEAQIEKKLGSDTIDAYLDGLEEFGRDYESLADQLQEQTTAVTQKAQDDTSRRLENLKSKQKGMERETKGVEATQGELKEQYDKELQSIEQRRKDLERDQADLSGDAERLDRMISQTRIDIARLETELNLRGITRREIALQPSLVQLQSELSQYQNQYVELQGRRQELVATRNELNATRAAVGDRFRDVKGTLQQQSDKLTKRGKAYQRRANKLSQTPKTNTQARPGGNRLADPASFFNFDFDAEAATLLAKHGATLETKSADRAAGNTATSKRKAD